VTVTPELRETMLAAIPNLRAFAISLTNNVDAADALVQDTNLRAWTHIDRFQPGTNLHAWLFTILRNGFYSRYRKARREIGDPDGTFASRLVTIPEQGAMCDFEDLRTALAKLSVEHREALILIGAEGLSYAEAAQVCGVAVGTMKSRVHRARERLGQLLAIYGADDLGPDRMTQAALQAAH